MGHALTKVYAETSDQSSILDLVPDFGAEPRGADGAGVPAVGGRFAGALAGIAGALRRALRRAPGRRALAIVGEQALDGFDQRRQRGFGVGGDGQIDFGVALEVLVVALGEEIVGGDADELGAMLE